MWVLNCTCCQERSVVLLCTVVCIEKTLIKYIQPIYVRTNLLITQSVNVKYFQCSQMSLLLIVINDKLEIKNNASKTFQQQQDITEKSHFPALFRKSYIHSFKIKKIGGKTLSIVAQLVPQKKSRTQMRHVHSQNTRFQLTVSVLSVVCAIGVL